MKCMYCGEPLKTDGTCNCWQSKQESSDQSNELINLLDSLKALGYHSDQPEFNFQCPNCSGRYNMPIVVLKPDGYIYKCPFCGRIMEGLNNV